MDMEWIESSSTHVSGQIDSSTTPAGSIGEQDSTEPEHAVKSSREYDAETLDCAKILLGLKLSPSPLAVAKDSDTIGQATEINTVKVCLYCGEPALQSCSSCLIAHYCTKEHQKKHWKIHKLSCYPIRVEKFNLISEYGFIRAARDVQQGEVIWIEDAVILLPFANMNIYNNKAISFCVSCYQILNCGSVKDVRIRIKRCPGCRFPVCRNECSVSASHIQDCQMLRRYDDQTELEKSISTPSKVALLLCLLRLYKAKNETGKRWKMLSAMASTSAGVQIRQDTQEFLDSNRDVVRTAGIMLNKPVPLKITVSELSDILLRFHSVLFDRAFLSYPDSMSYAYGHLYETASLFRHACIPNAAASIRQSGKVAIKASMNIERGSEITLAKYGVEEVYLKFEELQYAIRQHVWVHSNCSCSTCQQPTDALRLTNAHKCGRCEGYLLVPKALLSVGDFRARWKCNECDNSGFTSDLRLEIFQYEDKFRGLLDRVVIMDYSYLEDLSALIKLLQSRLHPRHYLLIRSMKLYSLSYEMMAGMTTQQLLTAYEYQMELLEVYNVVAPGINVGRGLVLFKLHQICEYLVLGDVLKAKSADEPWESPTIVSRWVEMKAYLKAAQETFAWRKDCVQAKELDQIITCLERHSPSTNSSPFLTCLPPQQIMASVKGIRSDPICNLEDIDQQSDLAMTALYLRMTTLCVAKYGDFIMLQEDQACVTKLEKFLNVMGNRDRVPVPEVKKLRID